MASFLASIYGTEQDKVNCSFYYKIGACRHGDRCSRKHTKPAFSQTILVSNVYQNPRHNDPECNMSDDDLQDQFDDFYEDFFCELAKHGQLVEMHVCDNVGEHLIGNVYARYEWEEEAQRAVDALNDQWYNGRPLFAELSPVTDFREACCRQNETNECNRGGFCNFMHLRYASPSLIRQLQHELAVELKMRKEAKKGWKERIGADADGAAAASDGDDVPSWKKGKSSGNWRSGADGGDPAGDDRENGSRTSAADPTAGANRPTGADGPEAGSAREYTEEKRADEDGARHRERERERERDHTREKMRGWQDSPRRSDSPAPRA